MLQTPAKLRHQDDSRELEVRLLTIIKKPLSHDLLGQLSRPYPRDNVSKCLWSTHIASVFLHLLTMECTDFANYLVAGSARPQSRDAVANIKPSLIGPTPQVSALFSLHVCNAFMTPRSFLLLKSCNRE